MNDQSKLVHTILISGFVIIKKGEIVEARLQEDVLMMPKEHASQVLFNPRNPRYMIKKTSRIFKVENESWNLEVGITGSWKLEMEVIGS